MADDHDDGECLLGSPSPDDDRRAWLKRKAPVEGTGAREALLPPLAGRGHGLDLDYRPVLAQEPAILPLAHETELQLPDAALDQRQDAPGLREPVRLARSIEFDSHYCTSRSSAATWCS